MPGIDGQLELFAEVSVGRREVVIFVKVLYVEDKSWQSRVISLRMFFIWQVGFCKIQNH